MANFKLRNKINRGRHYNGGDAKSIARTRDLTRIISILRDNPEREFIRQELIREFTVNETNMNDALLFLTNHKIILMRYSQKRKWRSGSVKQYKINKKFLEFLNEK